MLHTKEELNAHEYCVCYVEWIDAFIKDHAPINSIVSEEPVLQHTFGVLIMKREGFVIILHELTALSDTEYYIHYTAVPYSIIKDIQVYSEPIVPIKNIVERAFGL